MTRHQALKIDPTTLGQHNFLLGRLKSEDLSALTPISEVWAGERGETLFEPGDPVEYTYFPCDAALVSFRVVFADGESVETALVGREGAVGGIVSQGHLPAFSLAVIQYPGTFIRVRTTRLEEAKLTSWPIRHLFARYADCLIAQVFQASACNAAHTIEQRAAKWLLAALDRTGDHVVPLTQEQLGGLIGVGRSYINRVMRKWRQDEILVWRRGSLTVLDIDALRSIECRCNRAVKDHFDAVLAGAYPRCAPGAR